MAYKINIYELFVHIVIKLLEEFLIAEHGQQKVTTHAPTIIQSHH